MGTKFTIISMIISLGFWVLFLYIIIRFIRKRKQPSKIETSQTKASVAEETKWSKISKILRWRVTSMRSKLLFVVMGLALISVGIWFITSNNIIGINEKDSGHTTYYVKSETANVRECPDISCKVINALTQNTDLTFPGNLFEKYPDWAEVTFSDGKVGYVNKSVLTSEVPAGVAPASPPRENEILLGEGDFAPAIVGQQYTISFCQPESVRSGTTCGGLAGKTTSPVGGSPPYSFVKSSGFLPPGTSLELNGLLSGVLTTAGTYTFKICAKDLQMNQGCRDYTLVVNKTGVINPPLLPPDNLRPSVSIDSITCTLIDDDNQPEPYTTYTFEISLLGTADAANQLHALRVSGPGLREVEAGYTGPNWDLGTEYFNGAWTGYKSLEMLSRAENDPSTITWEKGGWIYRGQRIENQIPAEILIHARLGSFGVSVAEAEKVVVCSP